MEKGTTEDETAGWHHRLNGREFEQALGDGEGQGSLACCSPWGCKESDTTEQLNNNSSPGRVWLTRLSLCHGLAWSGKRITLLVSWLGENYSPTKTFMTAKELH